MNKDAHTALASEVDWVARVIHAAVKAYLDGRTAPAIEGPASLLNGLDRLEPEERVIAALALAASLKPEVFDACIVADPRTGRPFTVFGIDQTVDGNLLPSLRTAAFVLSGGDITGSLRALQLTATDGRLVRDGYVFIQTQKAENRISARLYPGRHWSVLLGIGRVPLIAGAEPLTTNLEPEDLVVPASLKRALDDIKTWLRHGRHLLEKWGLQRHFDQGYRALFYGPSGTGKTLAAALIGKEMGVPVYRVDLSRTVSKWIGETEKNLASLFDQAEQQSAVLFFDEADALFGKRTETKSANDRYANQEVSYLLQRIEAARNLVILATNLRGNIDAAFSRRFQSVVYFPVPDAAARTTLWHQVLDKVPLGPDVDVLHLAKTEDVTGATIVNTVRSAALEAEAKGENVLTRASIVAALRRERLKEGGIQTS